MVNARIIRDFFPGRGPNGRRLCRWCKEEVTPPRTHWCGKPECIHEWNIRRDPQYARAHVRLRDHGVCAICGIDTDALKAAWRCAYNRACDECALKRWGCAHDPECPKKTVDARLRALGFNGGLFWEADHIVPVVKGGGGCGLEGLRTLCEPCHKYVTRVLAWERARDRQAVLRENHGVRSGSRKYRKSRPCPRPPSWWPRSTKSNRTIERLSCAGRRK